MIRESSLRFGAEPSHTTPVDAAGWVVRLHSDQSVRSDDVEFDAWKTDPSNEKEFAVHEDLWLAVGKLADNPEARAILTRSSEQKTRSWVKRASIGILALGAMAATIAVMVLPRSVEQHQYQTARGERRNILLADGSAIILNTDSQLRVALNEEERQVVLERGEFFVQVAKDAQRPFRVFVADHEIRALGTAFDVYRDHAEKRTEVTLESGVIAIYDSAASKDLGFIDRIRAELTIEEPSVVLKPGERATLVSMAAPMVTVAARGINDAWRSGRIVFDNTPLSEAVKDVNRYRQRQIVIGDRTLVGLRISGVFQIDQLDGFVESLIAAFPIRVEREDATITVITSG